MKKRIFALLLSAMTMTLFAAESPNLLKNATFTERVAAANKPPVGWGVNRSTAKIEYLAEKGALTLANTVKDESVALTYQLKLDPEKLYFFSCRVKAQASTMTQTYVESIVNDAAGKPKWLGVNTNKTPIGTAWEERSFHFRVPEKASSCYLALVSSVGMPVTFKDVCIREASTRKQLGGIWNLDAFPESPDNGVMVSGTKTAVLQNVPVKPGKVYRLTYTARGYGKTGSDYPFHEIITLVKPQVQGAYCFNDVRTTPQPKFHQFTVPANANINKISIEFTVKSTAGKVLFYDFALTEVVPDPRDQWRFFLTEPFYRNIIFSSTDTGRIAGTVCADPTAASARVDVDGVGTTSFELKDGKADFSIPAKNLKVGKYPVTCRVYDAAGNVQKSFKFDVARVPKGKHEVIAWRNNYFMFDGKPFFPVTQWNIGFKAEESFYYAARHGINSTIVYFSGRRDKSLKLLDLAHKYGMKLIASGGFIETPSPEKTARFLKSMEERFPPEVRNHPAFFGYFMTDEPLWGGMPSSSLAFTQELYKDFDPYHPTWINAAPRNEVPDLIPYAAACDIYGCDIYPVPPPNSHSGIDDKGLTSVGKYCLRMNETTFWRKPIWMALQGFAWAGLNRATPLDKHVYPTHTEMRFMAMDAMLNGCTGYGLWGTQLIKSAQFYQDMYDTSAELRLFSALFVNGRQLADVKTDNASVRIAVFGHMNNLYFFVMNLTDKATSATLRTSLRCRNLMIVPEGGKLPLEGGAATLQLQPFEVVVCGTSSLPAPLYGLPSVDKDIEKLGAPFAVLAQKGADAMAKTNFYRGKANWIWAKEAVEIAGGCAFVGKSFRVDDVRKGASLKVAVDDFSTVYLNGKEIGNTENWSSMFVFNLAKALKAGENILLIKAEDGGTLPCGVLAELTVAGKVVSVSGADWLAATADGPAVPANLNGFKPAFVIVPYGAGAWGNDVIIQ